MEWIQKDEGTRSNMEYEYSFINRHKIGREVRMKCLEWTRVNYDGKEGGGGKREDFKSLFR